MCGPYLDHDSDKSTIKKACLGRSGKIEHRLVDWKTALLILPSVMILQLDLSLYLDKRIWCLISFKIYQHKSTKLLQRK